MPLLKAVMPQSFPVFDAHLVLAMNVERGRDVRRPAAEQPLDRGMIATVGLPDLTRGGVTHACPTIFCSPAGPGKPGYHSPDEAFAQAQRQIATYHAWAAEGCIALPGTAAPATALQAILLIEGAECIRTPDDLAYFHHAGVRIVGLAWQATRYAGGTATPGPLAAAGRDLVHHLDRLGFIHDVSHLAEQSFWDLLHVAANPIIASHSNCRSIVGRDPGERHLTDAMIRALAARAGVIGINLFDKFLLPADAYGHRRATLDDVVTHIRHVCDLVGDARHVAIGTDMDGGLGRAEIPVEIETSADLPRIGEALAAAGFGDAAIRDILFNNWHRRLIDQATKGAV